MKIVKKITIILMSFCVATVFAEGIGLAALWWRGQLDPDRAYAVLAIVYGVEKDSMSDGSKTGDAEDLGEQASFEDVLRMRTMVKLDLDLRESAGVKGLADLRYLEEQLKYEDDTYDELKTAFDGQLARVQGAASDPALVEVRNTLESLPPRQAKEQILRMLDEGRQRNDQQVMHDVVALFKSMPLEKRKKIVAEFKSAEEEEQLAELLRQIRLGMPDIALIRKTRVQLEQFDPRKTKAPKDGSVNLRKNERPDTARSIDRAQQPFRAVRAP